MYVFFKIRMQTSHEMSKTSEVMVLWWQPWDILGAIPCLYRFPGKVGTVYQALGWSKYCVPSTFLTFPQILTHLFLIRGQGRHYHSPFTIVKTEGAGFCRVTQPALNPSAVAFWVNVFNFSHRECSCLAGFIYSYLMYECFTQMYVYMPCACLVLTEPRRGHQIRGNWSYR